MSNVDLRKLLEKILSDAIPRNDLVQLIHFCRSITESYLLHHRRSITRICSLNGFTVSDLATDCIAEIFLRDETNKFPRLIGFVRSLDNALHETPEIDLFLAFKAFVGQVAKVQLARIYSEWDPEGAKILRNVKDALKTSQTLVLVNEIHGLSIYTVKSDPLLHRQEFRLDQLERELFRPTRRSTNIPNLLKSLEEILSGQSSYRRTVVLIDLVQILKKYFVHFSDYNEDVSVSSEALWALSQQDLRALRDESLKVVQQKIVTTYLLTGKITRVEAVGLSNALASILNDWIEHKEVQDSFAKRTVQALSISLEEYEEHWRTKVEYLTKIARERLATGIQENL